MLNFFRDNIKLIIWLIVLSFVGWGVGTMSLSTDQSAAHAGSVFGKNVSHKELLMTLRFFDIMTQTQISNLKQALREERENLQEGSETDGSDSKAETQNADSETEDLEPPSVDQLRVLAWQTIVLSRAAQAEGVPVTDDEVVTLVENFFGGTARSNPQFYQNWVEQNFRGKPRDFEEVVRNYLAAQKMKDRVLADVPEEEQTTKWASWFISLMERAEFKDYTKEALVQNES